MRVLALESRRAAEMEQLIRKQGGEPFVAPSMREIPLAENSAAFAFAEKLFAGGFDMVILLTGVGTRQLNRLLATRFPESAFAEALARVTVVARALGIEDATLASLRKCQVCSIGPATTEALEEFGVHPVMEPSHPKMGFLVKEAAGRATQ